MEGVPEILEDLKKRVEALEKNRGGVSVDQMFSYFNERVIGTKEFRNFLAKIDDNFNAVRDSTVDDEIDRVARERAKVQQEGLRMVDKDGNVIEG